MDKRHFFIFFSAFFIVIFFIIFILCHKSQTLGSVSIYEMGEVSGRMADLTIITSDNPRFEEPQAIIDDIKTGIAKTNGKYVEICDRKEAIAYAIHHGEPGDIIVLAGKGHEDYQEIKGKKYPMDERVLIAEILKEDQEKDQ